MDILPNELLLHSFSYLPTTDLKALRLANKFYSDICISVLFSSEAHLVLTLESTERLIDISHHAKIRPLITSLLYEANPLDRFDMRGWMTHVRNGYHSSLSSQPRNPNRHISLRDQHQEAHESKSTAKTRNALKAGWAAYGAMRAWQREMLEDHSHNYDIYQAIGRFPNLKTIKIYIGPFTSYAQQSFASTFLPYSGRMEIQALNLPPPGLQVLWQDELATSVRREKSKAILSCIKVMYLDEIDVNSIPNPFCPDAFQIYSSLHWLQDLRVAFESRQKGTTMHESLKDRIKTFLGHTPNLQRLDIGWTYYGTGIHYPEWTELFGILGQIKWAHLNTIMLRGWRMSTAGILDFCQQHKETLRSINLDSPTLLCDARDPWATFLEDIRRLKQWERVEIWGPLEDVRGNQYMVGWPPETAWVKNGISNFSEYVNEPLYYDYTKKAREQIEEYTRGQTDVNPFFKGEAADACAVNRNFEHVEGDFSKLVPEMW